MDRIPTPKEIRDILKRLTPEQRNLIDSEIAKASVKFRRSLFRLIPGRTPIRSLLTDSPG
jgi:hypothetical protein